MDVSETWRHLLILLEHMLTESERPAASRLFRAQGSRRLSVAQKQLHGERQELLNICGRWGLIIAPEEVRDAAQGLPPLDDLEDDYVELAKGYRIAAEIAERLGDPIAANWLQVRANIHDLQRLVLKS